MPLGDINVEYDIHSMSSVQVWEVDYGQGGADTEIHEARQDSIQYHLRINSHTTGSSAYSTPAPVPGTYAASTCLAPSPRYLSH